MISKGGPISISIYYMGAIGINSICFLALDHVHFVLFI